jgi:putative heme-binding domain-containing protein
MSSLVSRVGLVRRFAWVVVAALVPAVVAHAAPAEPEALDVLPGFKAELLLAADAKVNGSWINLGKDNKGRLLLGGQRGQPVTRVTLKDGKVDKAEVLKFPVSEVMGFLWAFDSLYVNASGKAEVPGANGKPSTKDVYGLWRLRPNAEDQYDKAEFLREWKGGAGEHGAHGIVLGADKKLYIVCGNFVGLPEDLLPSSPHKNYADDLALPRAEDGNGFGAGRKPPGGFVVRVDENGKNAELFASGERNTYDIAFNADGELFGFDSDMEWDWGTPWYRPVRVFQATSGADHGFREGTAKWPTYYPDSLPPNVEIGVGCPTGVAFGTGAKFPAKYQKAFYILDWTYGRLIAVHLQPKGAGYVGSWENFVAPAGLRTGKDKKPLNLTDVVIGDDGAMYFTIGGRNTGAALYRVTYTGTEPTAAADLHDAEGAKDRELRRSIEAFHGKADPKAVEAVWAHLGSDDRYISYAARIALESQPVEQWKSRALSEKDPKVALTALLSLARLGGSAAQEDLFKAVAKLPLSALDEQHQFAKVRVIEVSIARDGKPAADVAKAVVAELNPLFPGKNALLNRELAQVLLALDAPDAVAKAMKIVEEAKDQEEQLYYILNLRTVTSGWTPALRQAYFGWFAKGLKDASHPAEVVKWFADAGRPYGDGSSFPKFIGNTHAQAAKTLTPSETAALQPVLAAYVPPGTKAKPTGKPKVRPVVKDWKMTDLEPRLAEASKGRDYNRGKEAYEAAQCQLCHKFGNDGGAVGPELTTISTRFSRKDVLESIIEPSKVVSEQFQNTIVETKDGESYAGRILEEDGTKLVIQPNPLAPEKVTVKKSEISDRRLSKLSPMPAGLANILTAEEILDLVAYMESGGKRDAANFGK